MAGLLWTGHHFIIRSERGREGRDEVIPLYTYIHTYIGFTGYSVCMYKGTSAWLCPITKTVNVFRGWTGNGFYHIDFESSHCISQETYIRSVITLAVAVNISFSLFLLSVFIHFIMSRVLDQLITSCNHLSDDVSCSSFLLLGVLLQRPCGLPHLLLSSSPNHSSSLQLDKEYIRNTVSR